MTHPTAPPRGDDQESRRAYRVARRRPQPADSSPRRIYELLRASIRDGSIGAGEQLDEHSLVKTYNASRNSVRKALRSLAEEGLLDRGRRVGTSLSRTIVPIAPTDVGPRVYRGTTREGRLAVETLECTRVVAGHAVGRRLRIDPGAEVVRLDQLARFDGEPLYLRTAYLVTDRSAAEQLALLAQIHEDYPPMPVVFHRVFGRAYGASIYAVEAIALEERIADMLDEAPGTPTLLRELTTTDVEGRPFELSFTYFRTGRAALSGIGTFTESGYGVL
ncbi:GntR family transcriptional regulator [Pseudonocardia sp. WMMC193]|uniref:GntR family transcriptional regulator n=1 Tax=Pseudonocardia sp. WMMC193 TaxID=2911965 RepID=UPI001F32FE47|nr:GntR family transcriptional regulator [Pseudonocardia sp. WMMC193]MCF7548389.1 GntR family transcriptional regulator [Pseudonocardia sp. WMMC193]